MATQESVSLKATTAPGSDKADHKATMDGGLKMKIMRSKANESGSESKHKIVKSDATNGLESNPKTNNGSSNASKNKLKDNKTQSSVECNAPSSDQKNMFSESGAMPSKTLSAKNVPVSNLFSTQTSKYPYQCRDVAGSNPSSVQSTNKCFNSPGPPKRVKKEENTKKSPENGKESLKNDDGSPPSKKKKGSGDAKVDRCVGTSFGTLTEPECLGPCEPGTSVNLDGIVWHETEDGILVVNATWRGRSYVGTLLDSTRHDWAPPRPNDGNEDWDCRTRAGRAKRRNATYGPDLNNSLTPKPRNCNKVRSTRDGSMSDNFTSNAAKPASPRPDIRRSRDDASSNDESNIQSLVNPVTGLQVEIPNMIRPTVAPCPVSPTLLECPEQDCNKKFKNVSGLRYHQSRVHGADCFDEESRHSFDAPLTPIPHQEASRSAELATSNGDSKHAKNDVDGVSSSTQDAFSEIRTSVTNKDPLTEQSCDMDEETPLNRIVNSCDNEVVSSSCGSKEQNMTPSGVKNSNNALISVKRDIFETRNPEDTGDEKHNAKQHKSPFMLSLSNMDCLAFPDGATSPAYSDISDDSMSFSSSDFIDKLLKSTENKILPLESVDQLHPTNSYQSSTEQKIPPQETIQIPQEGENSRDKPVIKDSLLPTGNLPGQLSTTSSTFINPYNLINCNFSFSSNVKTEDLELPNDMKVEDASHKPDSSQKNPTMESNQNGAGFGNSSTADQSAELPTNAKTNQIQPIKPKSEPKELDNKDNIINQSKHSDEGNIEVKYSISKSSQLSDSKQNIQQTFQPPTSSNLQQGVKYEPQRNQSPGSFNRNIKDEKNVKIKSEPQLPPTSRPPGAPPQYMPHPQYMNQPNFGFNPGFQQYQNNLVSGPTYGMPYYNPPMPRYSMPANEQSKPNIAPQYMPNHPYGAANFSVPSTLSNFPSSQSSPLSTMANSANIPQRIDANRIQTGPPNGRTSAQTHFHTHHHTHVGLGYPMYAPSYEPGVLPGQQGPTSPLAPYSARPTK